MSKNCGNPPPWERLVGWWLVGIVKDEGCELTFDSMWENHKEALKRYRELLKSDKIHCMVFVTKIVASMDKAVRYYYDHGEKHPPAHGVFGRLGKEEYDRVVTTYIKQLTEKQEKKEGALKKWLKV